MRTKKIVAAIIILLSCTVFASVPLFSSSYIPTHDGEYHIIRFIEFFRMINSGYLFPRWAPTLNSGYGIPIFSFHYPFPNYIGSFFQYFTNDAVAAFKYSLALGYILAAGFSFIWLKKLFGIKAGLTGAIVGAFVPYWFVDIYVRGSVGEVFALAFVFAALVSVEYRNMLALSVSMAMLILSHNILAMLFFPFLLIYTLLRSKKMFLAFPIGVLLSTYFWLPAILERIYVVGLNTVNYKEHFAQLYELLIPSWGTALSSQSIDGNKMSFQIGVIPIVIIFSSIALAVKETLRPLRRIYSFMLVVFLFGMFCILPISEIIWGTLPILGFVQYPWRILSFVIPITAFMASYVSYHIKMRFISVLMILLSIAFSYSYSRPVLYQPRDSAYYLSRPNFVDGTSSMGNSFSTIWTGWKKERPKARISVLNGKLAGAYMHDSYLFKEFTIETTTGAAVDMPILYYPGWEVLLDKKQAPIDFKRDGTIHFTVPVGAHDVIIRFTETPIRVAANSISAVTLVWIVGWGILGIYERRRKHTSLDKRPQ